MAYPTHGPEYHERDSWKRPVRAASTGNGTLATAFENGDTLDGVTLATGDRILLKDQSTGSQNGIYTVNASGAPTRAVDFGSNAEIVGAVVLVTNGTANADTLWQCTTNATITVGTTALIFAAVGSVTRASLGLDTTDSPQFAGINVGSATDTTITRTGAGDIAVEGNALYRAGGTDVPVADGGTGASTASGARTNLGLALGTDIDARVMTTAGDLIVGGVSGAAARLAKGSDSQVLTVDPTTHLLVWATPSSGFANPMTTKGDLIVGDTGGSAIRKAVGSDGQVLTADAASTGGIKWAAGGVSGSVATDTIWDAKGDLAAGTGADTAAKVTVGANDTILMADSAQSTGLKWVASQTPTTQAFSDAAAQGTADTYARGDHVHGMPANPGGITSGTSNPVSPTNGDLFYRSDLDLLIRYRSSGTRWVCTCLHVQPFAQQTTPGILPMTANGSHYAGLDATARDLFVERVAVATIIPSGTNNGSNFWTIAVVNVSLGGSVVTSADGNSGVRHDLTGGTIASGTIYAEMTATKTGAPGSLYVMEAGIVYRYIVT